MTQGPIGMLGMKSADASQLEGFRQLALQIGIEAYRVAQAGGVQIEPVFGLSQHDLDGSAEIVVEKLLSTLLLHLGKNSRNAVVQDHAKGRRTEVPYINGLVAQKGLTWQIPTPLNLAVDRINRDIELKKMNATPENLKRILTYL